MIKKTQVFLIMVALILLSPATGSAQWTQLQLPNNHPEAFALSVFEDINLFIGSGGLPNSTSAIGILWSNCEGLNVIQRSNGPAATANDSVIRALTSWRGIRVAGGGKCADPEDGTPEGIGLSPEAPSPYGDKIL